MFGKNEIAYQRNALEGFMVKSIWYTIQGEGPWAGKPTIFVRLAGCNLRCFFCDTDFENGTHMDAEALAGAISNLVKRSNCHDIVFTGGEPMLQPLPSVMRRLPGRLFQIETAGTVWPANMEEHLNRTTIVCSPKTGKVHPKIEEHTSAWKYILRAGEIDPLDGLPVRSTQVADRPLRIYRARERDSMADIYVQACDEQTDVVASANNLKATVDVALQHGYRLSLQMHKIVGLE